MTKKNLLILSPEFCLETGGISNTAYLFAEYFQKYFNVFTLCPPNSKWSDIKGVHAYKSGYSWSRLLTAIDFIRVVIRIHKKHKIDYIISTHFSNALCCVPIKYLYNIPYGVLAHGEEVVKSPQKGFMMNMLWWTLVIPMRKLIFNKADDIFANTKFTKGLVEQITSNSRITIINPPIGTKSYGNEITNNKTSYILSIGRLVERKGYQNVVRAIKYIKEKKPDVEYIIAGSGEYENKIKQLIIDNNLCDYVKMLGRVSEEEKCDLIKKCSLFVMPSYKIMGDSSIEGFGLSLLEANSYGKFVISTYSGGIPEAVINGKTGFLVEENNVDKLAEAIINYYAPNFNYDPQICKNWAEKRFITNIVEEYYIQISKCFK